MITPNVARIEDGLMMVAEYNALRESPEAVDFFAGKQRIERDTVIEL